VGVMMSKENKEEEDIWSKGTKCCEVKQKIDCSYWDKFAVLPFAWITRLGVACARANCTYGTLVQPPWDTIAIQLLLMASLGWDTLAYFGVPPNKPIQPSRRARQAVIRHKRARNPGKSMFLGCVI
jgi:hypothetical protein